MQRYKGAISDFIDSKRNEMIEVLRTIMRIPSVQGDALPDMPFGEAAAKALTLVLQICREAGFDTKNIDNYVGSADFCPDANFPELGILCHLDVVPEGSGWTVPPFDLTEINSRLIGRGAIDDKGPAVAALYAVLAVKELGIPLKKGVRLIFGTNEENGSSDLLYYRKKEKLPNLLFTPDGSYPIINSEKGMLRICFSADSPSNSLQTEKNVIIHSIKGGKAINAVPEFAEAIVSGISIDEINRTISDLDLNVTFDLYDKYNLVQINTNGKSAHASLPHHGENAITALLTLLNRLTDNYPVLTEISRLYQHGETNGKSLGITYSDDFTSVLSVISFDGFKLEAKADVRFPIGKSSFEIIDTIKNSINNDTVQMAVIFQNEPHFVDENSEFVKTLLEVYSDITGNDGYCVAIGGGTYVHGIPNGVAFGAEFPNENNNMHGADEFITVDSLLLNAKIYAHSIVKICGKKIL